MRLGADSRLPPRHAPRRVHPETETTGLESSRSSYVSVQIRIHRPGGPPIDATDPDCIRK